MAPNRDDLELRASVALAPPKVCCGSAALTELSQRDLEPLVQLGVRFLGCHHLAEDALQEALIALSQQADTVDKPLAWLTRAMVHRCRHLRRTARRRQLHEHRASQDCELHRDCENPLHIAIAHETGDRIAQVRDSLPPEQSMALDLYEVAGQDYRGISEQLGVPVGTVRSRLARARQALRAALGEQEQAKAKSCGCDTEAPAEGAALSA